MKPDLDTLNAASADQFVQALHGIYEHSPWIPERAASARPFGTPQALKLALARVVREASETEQLGLIRAHPELAGKAAIAGELTQESTGEQAKAGLNLCSAEEYAILHRLNAEYNAKFGFPFILAVKGPTGQGLSRQAIIATFERRLRHQKAQEQAECLRQIDRIAELRLNDLLGVAPAMGNQIMQWAETMAQWSDEADALTCAFMTPAHQQTAKYLASLMEQSGMQVAIDAIGNVVGRYPSPDPDAKTLMTGSHYDTVRNGGKYDGRQGILAPIAVVRALHARGETLPFHLEVVGFSEEEGVRYKSTFLGSNAIIGQFDPALLEKEDAEGLSMENALTLAGLDPGEIVAIARDPAQLLGFVELHIEQGPVLLEQGLPAGVVTAIAGSSRFLVRLEGVASHAGTTPMHMRQDAACAAAEIALLVEARCASQLGLVGTVGQLEVPGGSVNVIPGACKLSLDIRAGDDAMRQAAVADVLKGLDEICARRRIVPHIEPLVDASAAPCAPWLMEQLDRAVERAGVPVFHLPSGAGHDAMTLAKITPVAMLFARCGNGGISHNPLETMTADDAELSAQILLDLLRNFVSPEGRKCNA
jgi:N-carbamoyl-L-amino-acid hydrolase